MQTDKETRGQTPPVRRPPEVDEGKELTASRRAGGIFTRPLVRRATLESFRKLDPRVVAKNPVMFVVEVGAAGTTIILVAQMLTRTGNIGFTFQISVWLWFTVVLANFAEAMAEARGKAQAETLRATKKETPARRIRDSREEIVSSSALRKGDVIGYRPAPASELLARNLLIWGVGGIVAPFLGIKAIDVLVSALGLA